MSCRIYITRAAERDLQSATDYIENVLLNPSAADTLLEEAEKIIGGLCAFPEKYALADDPFLRGHGIRYAAIKNYLAFCTVSEDGQAVHVIRFLYGKRNWLPILKWNLS